MISEDLPILYEDEALVAVAKPSGVVVHPTRGAEGSPVVVHMLAERLKQPLYPLHRLDRQTSGVLILARSSADASRAAADIREHRWRKSYLGLCRGPLAEGLDVDHPVPEADKRRPARTRIDPLETFCGRFTLVRACPLTGRRHQLRYHLKHLRHPLVGDTNYGQGVINRFFRQTFALHRFFLHAERVELIHPRQAKLVRIDCPLDEQLDGVLSGLRCFEGAVP